jgi:hypothetical protein
VGVARCRHLLPAVVYIAIHIAAVAFVLERSILRATPSELRLALGIGRSAMTALSLTGPLALVWYAGVVRPRLVQVRRLVALTGIDADELLRLEDRGHGQREITHGERET